MSAHAPSGNTAPYKLLGVYGAAGGDDHRFRAAQPAHRDDPLRRQVVLEPDHGHPGDRATCRIDVVAAWNVFYYVPFVTPIAKFFGAKFVRQDQVTMIQQAEGLKHNPSLMLIDDADKPAKWYFALKQARLEAHPRSLNETRSAGSGQSISNSSGQAPGHPEHSIGWCQLGALANLIAGRRCGEILDRDCFGIDGQAHRQFPERLVP